MLLADWQIRDLVGSCGMIDPFVAEQVGNGAVSYGLSSFGYDLRVAGEFKVFTNLHSAVVDPKRFDPGCFVDVATEDRVVIPPNSFALGRSVEYFRIPDHVVTMCLGKSTYARCGIIVNVTPFEPGWHGHATLEISNTTPSPAVVYANEGLCQVMFFAGDRPVLTYRDKAGKYQGQVGVVGPRM